MTPNIEISHSDFERLQKLATPFVDTPASVISRLLDEHLSDNDNDTKANPNNVTVYHSENLPSLRHTKVLSGKFGGKKPKKNQWNSLIELALNEANLTGKIDSHAKENLKSECNLNVYVGNKTDQGYAFIPSLNISYQRVSAEHAGDVLTRFANWLGSDLDIEFEWREHEDAYKPGEKAVIRQMA